MTLTAALVQHKRDLSVKQVFSCLSSLLVPLMIGTATVVFSYQQMYNAKEQREQDIFLANQLRTQQLEIEERRLKEERVVAEINHMDTVLGSFLGEIANLLLSPNFTRSDIVTQSVLRAKVLTTLRQLDGRGKSDILLFLYEARMITNGNNPIDLRGADLSNVVLNGQDLEGISLQGASLVDVSFVRCLLRNASFVRTRLNNVSFVGSNIDKAQFNGAVMNNSFFEISALNMASFSTVKLENVEFSTCELRRVIFNSATMLHVTFKNCRLPHSSFCDVQGDYVQMIDLRESGSADMDIIVYPRTDLEHANFARALLRKTVFGDATLYEADFTYAKLYDCNFDRVLGNNARFAHAHAQGSSFNEADLAGSDWTDTNVWGTSFQNVDMQDMINMTLEQLFAMLSIENATLPEGSKGRDTNLLVNGNAEAGNDCESDGLEPWQSNYTVRRRYKNATMSLGKCYFDGEVDRGGRGVAYMRQYIVLSVKLIEVVRTNTASSWLGARCSATSGGLTTIKLEQYNSTNHLVKDSVAREYKLSVPFISYAFYVE
jgi:uncharacterized protein YjbI with pentapeptide repeats